MDLVETAPPEAGMLQEVPVGPVLLIPEARDHQHRRHRRFAAVVIALAFIVAVILAAGNVFLGGGDSVSAGDGGPAPAIELKADSAACQAFWKSMLGRSPLPGSAPASLPAVTVSDVRGSEAALLYIDGPGSWTCFLSSSSVVGLGGSPDGSFSRTPSPAHPVTLSSPALWTNVNAKFQMVEGQAARDVSSLTLTLSDGTMVRPALRNGYFVAFWPGTASAVSSAYRIGDETYQSGGAPASPFPSSWRSAAHG